MTDKSKSPLSGLSQADINKLNQWESYASFKDTWIWNKLIFSRERIRACFAGNRAGKTSMIAREYVLRACSMHPVPSKNFDVLTCDPANIWKAHRFSMKFRRIGSPCPKCQKPLVLWCNPYRIVRCASENLPGESEDVGGYGLSAEIKNTQYPALKKWLPKYLIKKDINSRNKGLRIADIHGGPDIIFEFVSYNQSTQGQAGVARFSIWYDEHPPWAFYDENRMRVLDTGGDQIIGLTPAVSMCLDEATEILTEKGWSKYNQILMTDKILTYSIERDCYEWKQLNGFHMYYTNEDMYRMKGWEFDALVTGNHRWVVCNVRDKDKLFLLETEKLNTKHRIKRVSNLSNNTKDNPLFDDEFIALVGWAVTDGTFRDGGTRITIYQSQTAYPGHCAAIRKLLGRYNGYFLETTHEYKSRIMPGGRLWSGSGAMSHFSINGELARRMRSVTNGKTINQEFICGLSERQLNILFEAMIDGDGHRYKNGSIKFNQTENKKLCDDFQLVATLLGRKTTIREPEWFKKHNPGKVQTEVYVHTKSKRFSENSHYKSFKTTRVPYEGIIWCPSTENGTLVMRRNGITTISGNSWEFDEIYSRAKKYYRTETISRVLEAPQEEVTDSKSSIAVFQFASDDNPIIDKRTLEDTFAEVTDPDDLMIRRYGVFRQVSTTIYKNFSYDPHFQPMEKWFPNGVPENWLHARSVDWHPVVRLGVVAMSLSDHNELFVWWEANPSPQKVCTEEWAEEIARGTDGYVFKIDRIDPLAATKRRVRDAEGDRTTSVVDDLNLALKKLKQVGIGTGGRFIGFDTKGTRGRENLKTRIKNSKDCKEPFSNKRLDVRGEEYYLPTVWVMDTCPIVARSLKNWRLEERSPNDVVSKDERESPQQKYSHFPTAIEGILKESTFRPPVAWDRPDDRNRSSYFSDGRPGTREIHAVLR